VITGAGSGMGAATAELAAHYGANVMVSDVNGPLAAETADRIRHSGGSAASNACDVADPAQIDELIADTVTAFGGIDVLHNNAGIADAGVSPTLGVDGLTIEAWDKIIAVNLRAPWLTTRAALPFLKQSPNASVINVGSVGSFVAFPQTIAYGASKGGVALLTKNLALDLAPFNIRVNAYAPGVIETQMATNFFEASADGRKARDEIIASHLVPRLGRPDEVAELACFLASPRSSFINGVLYLIDGGQLAWRGQRAAE